MKHKRYLAACILLLLYPTFLTAQPFYQPCTANNPHHLIVNKTYPLPADYEPADLVIPNVAFTFYGTHQKSYLTATAASALEALFEAAHQDGIVLGAVSGYRSYERQKELFANYVHRDGLSLADTYSARPGTSEHQTGLAIDLSAPSVQYRLVEALGDTKEGIWLSENAHHYGYIIRYPKDKELLTGYIYEPWHIRYVGTELATTL